ncbi:MAG: hypothetical protein AAF399_16095 [Bacteroidota bacterium]
MRPWLSQYIFRTFLLVVCFAATSPLLADPSSHLAIHRLGSFPQNIVDTASYDFSFFVVNEDPINVWENSVAVVMSVDGDDPQALVSNLVPAFPVAPGDSILVQLNSYQFEPFRFQGGGITHDIIVWPMRVGLSQGDSAALTVTFKHTDELVSDHLSVDISDFPTVLHPGLQLDLTASLTNEDAEHALFHPVGLWVSVNGDEPTVLAGEILPQPPLAAGESMEIAIEGIELEAARFQGGGITHDIIVWPMASMVGTVDSLHILVRYQHVSVPATLTPTGQAEKPFFIGVDGVLRWKKRLEKTSDIDIKMYSLQGELVIDRTETLSAGVPVVAIPVQRLNQGLYLYEVRLQSGATYRDKWWHSNHSGSQ